MIKKLAEELKEARLKKDITLQQLFVRTRIDIKFLEAIENGNFDVLPEVYLRAFIKSYAGAVGLDESTIMKKFDAARTGKDYEERHTPEAHPTVKEERRQEPRIERKKEYVAYDAPTPSEVQDDTGSNRGARSGLVWIVLAGVLLIAALILYLIFFRGSTNQIISEKPFDEYLEKNSNRFEDTTANAKNNAAANQTDTMKAAQQVQTAAPAVKSDSLSLLIKSSGQSWVKVTADDNKKTYEFTMQANMQKGVKAKKNFHLVVGNAGAVQLQLNSAPLNFTGKSGEVKVAQVDSSGLVYSRSSKTTTNKPTTGKPTTGKTQNE